MSFFDKIKAYLNEEEPEDLIPEEEIKPKKEKVKKVRKKPIRKKKKLKAETIDSDEITMAKAKKALTEAKILL